MKIPTFDRFEEVEVCICIYLIQNPQLETNLRCDKALI